MPLSLDLIRSQFPALGLQDGGRPRIYLDNPGGTQVADCFTAYDHQALAAWLQQKCIAICSRT